MFTYIYDFTYRMLLMVQWHLSDVKDMQGISEQ